MLTQEQIRDLANKYQIDQYTILREYFQLVFLKYLYLSKASENVFFKGGTAIHFLFGSFRFSEDLDFTCKMTSDQLQHLLIATMEQLNAEAPHLHLSGPEDQKNAITALIKYSEGVKHPLTVRLEFSLREKPLTRQISPIETSFPVSPYPLVVHLSVEELMAEKIRALLMRAKGRDLFDLWLLLSKNIEIKPDYVQKKMSWYNKEYHPQDILNKIKHFPENKLEQDLGKFLPKHYRHFIKQIKPELIQKLSGRV